jgi:hypothetical protein
MGTSNDEPIKTLDELIELDTAAITAYEVALEKLAEDDLEVLEDLESFKADHEQHIRDLTRVVQALGGEPEQTTRDLPGMFLEGMTMLRAVTGTVGVLKAMRLNERLTNRIYGKAAEVAVPPLATAVIMQYLDDERRHLAVIDRHIDRLVGEDAAITRDDLAFDEEERITRDVPIDVGGRPSI